MSTIVTDTLQGKTSATSITLPTTTNIGATPLVSASANSMTIRGEGSAVTNIQQGLCKAWAGTVSDSASATDSFGISSISDTGTGDNRINYTNSFANVGYAAVTGTGNTGSSEPDRVIFCHLMETGTLRMQTMIANTGADSGIEQHIQLCGDLA